MLAKLTSGGHVYVHLIDRPDDDSVPSPDDFNHIYGLVEDPEMAQSFSAKICPAVSAAIETDNWRVIFTQSLTDDRVFHFDVAVVCQEHGDYIRKIVKEKIPQAVNGAFILVGQG